jgi:integrase/recombinase XerD
MSNPLRVAMSGPLAAVAAGFRAELLERGYRPGTVAKQLQLMAHVSRWLAAHDLEPYALASEQIEQFVRERRGSHAQLASARALEPLLGYLRGLGVVPPAGSREASASGTEALGHALLGTGLGAAQLTPTVCRSGSITTTTRSCPRG